MTRFEKFFVLSLFAYALASLVFAFVLYRSMVSLRRFSEAIVSLREKPPVYRLEVKQIK